MTDKQILKEAKRRHRKRIRENIKNWFEDNVPPILLALVISISIIAIWNIPALISIIKYKCELEWLHIFSVCWAVWPIIVFFLIFIAVCIIDKVKDHKKTIEEYKKIIAKENNILTKYAMVTINSRRDEHNKEIIRRVLIEYKTFKENVFKGTRFIEKDPYFYDENKSHQYEFKDKGYILISSNNEWSFTERHLINKLRPYHYNTEYSSLVGINESVLKPILFEASCDEEAIKIFNDRDELR